MPCAMQLFSNAFLSVRRLQLACRLPGKQLLCLQLLKHGVGQHRFAGEPMQICLCRDAKREWVDRMFSFGGRLNRKQKYSLVAS